MLSQPTIRRSQTTRFFGAGSILVILSLMGTAGGLRPSSAAFANNKSRPALSVILAGVSLAHGRGPTEVLAPHGG